MSTYLRGYDILLKKVGIMSYMKYLRDDQWDRIAGSLPGFSGTVGRPVEDNRRFVEGVIWVGRNGGRWRSLPRDYGKW